MKFPSVQPSISSVQHSGSQRNHYSRADRRSSWSLCRKSLASQLRAWVPVVPWFLLQPPLGWASCCSPEHSNRRPSGHFEKALLCAPRQGFRGQDQLLLSVLETQLRRCYFVMVLRTPCTNTLVCLEALCCCSAWLQGNILPFPPSMWYIQHTFFLLLPRQMNLWCKT